jgi:hypothetical protein
MNSQTILIDSIVQVFDSFGNRHLILGSASGEILESGDDVIVPSITIAIPNERLNNFLEQINVALTYVEKIPEVSDEEIMDPEVNGDSIFILKVYK